MTQRQARDAPCVSGSVYDCWFVVFVCFHNKPHRTKFVLKLTIMGQAASADAIRHAQHVLREHIQTWPKPLWTPVAAPSWSNGTDPYIRSARTGYEEILPDEERDRSIFHAAQVCNLITRFTTGPYNNAGLADIVSFLEQGPEQRSTHLSPDGTILGFGFNVAMPSATWSSIFQVVIGDAACMHLRDLGFDRVCLPPGNNDEVDTPSAPSPEDVEATGATEPAEPTKQEASKDEEDMDAKRVDNASAAIEKVAEALESSWVRIDKDVATDLFTLFTRALSAYEESEKK